MGVRTQGQVVQSVRLELGKVWIRQVDTAISAEMDNRNFTFATTRSKSYATIIAIIANLFLGEKSS